MHWSEFSALLSGLNSETPLGIICSIRAEDNPDVLKDFTAEQRKIRSEYRNKMAKTVPESKVDDFLDSIKQALIDMAGEQ